MGQDKTHGNRHDGQWRMRRDREVSVWHESLVVVSCLLNLGHHDRRRLCTIFFKRDGTSPTRLHRSMLTLQTCAGVLLTLMTIQLMPVIANYITWRYTFMAQAIGPFIGVICMLRLRRHPDSMRLANGRQ